MSHQFGGIWTQKKISVLKAYLSFYTQALKNQPFTLHYADAFAGTGSHTPAGRLDNQELLIPEEDFEGSVRAALGIEPQFGHYHFNDLSPRHVSELTLIRHEYPARQIHLYQQDANQFVPGFCKSLGWRDRAVLLLDPYSTQLDWATLEYVARSEKIDLWLLFPLSAILRMTPLKEDQIIPEWQATLDRLLGTDNWKEALYRPIEEPPIGDLFDVPQQAGVAERLNWQELESWVTKRLGEMFAYVEKPVRLTNRGRPLFLFYFAVSNPHTSAQDLARKAARHIMKHNIGSD